MLIAIESEYKMTIMNQTIRREVACGATLLLLTGSAQAQTLEEPFHMPTMTDTSTLDIVIVEDWHAGWGSAASLFARLPNPWRLGAGTVGRWCSNGTPGGIRTPDPQVRSLMLYPAELPARILLKC
jgi:hypothetical protein